MLWPAKRTVRLSMVAQAFERLSSRRRSVAFTATGGVRSVGRLPGCRRCVERQLLPVGLLRSKPVRCRRYLRQCSVGLVAVVPDGASQRRGRCLSLRGP